MKGADEKQNECIDVDETKKSELMEILVKFENYVVDITRELRDKEEQVKQRHIQKKRKTGPSLEEEEAVMPF